MLRFLFWHVSQRVQINLIFTNNIHTLSLSCTVKDSKIPVKLSARTKTGVVSSCSLVSYISSTCIPLPFLTVALHMISGTRFQINVREYRRGNAKWAFQRNWQHKEYLRRQQQKNTTQYVLDTAMRKKPHK